MNQYCERVLSIDCLCPVVDEARGRWQGGLRTFAGAGIGREMVQSVCPVTGGGRA
jgi:hypothetical protein